MFLSHVSEIPNQREGRDHVDLYIQMRWFKLLLKT